MSVCLRSATARSVGELLRAKITQTTVIRAFLTQAKHALEDIELLDTDIDRIYGKIDDAIGDIERYEKKGSAQEMGKVKTG